MRAEQAACADRLRRPLSASVGAPAPPTASPDGALKTIVAFANTAGGTLLVGVEDRSRHVRGVPDALDLEERLASLVSDRRFIPARAGRTTSPARARLAASTSGWARPTAAPTPS